MNRHHEAHWLVNTWQKKIKVTATIICFIILLALIIWGATVGVQKNPEAPPSAEKFLAAAGLPRSITSVRLDEESN